MSGTLKDDLLYFLRRCGPMSPLGGLTAEDLCDRLECATVKAQTDDDLLDALRLALGEGWGVGALLPNDTYRVQLSQRATLFYPSIASLRANGSKQVAAAMRMLAGEGPVR